MTADDDAPFSEQYPGFTIFCNKCDSERVSVRNSLGFSAESGQWGSVDLVCEDCGYIVEIVS